MFEMTTGMPYPLGATPDDEGTNFAISVGKDAEKVVLCLIDADGAEECLELTERSGNTWHAHVAGVGGGQLYGYRIHGPWDPASGLRFNPAKILIDPYAKAIEGDFNWGQHQFSYSFDNPDEIDSTDSLGHTMVGVVIDDEDFDWGEDERPNIPFNETVIYETHLKGHTQLHPDVPEEQRGTYAGMAHPKVLEHFNRLGVTAVELMPVHQFTNDSHLQDKGLSNYWGYNTLGYFAPQNTYSASGDRGQQVREFKEMVKAMHAAGLEVILDVVYNHTAEGNHMGPTLSFRGIDNPGYYHLVEGDERHYMDYTGTGNSLDLSNPMVLQLVMDSLRYWVEEMHVDGFRFDLATTLTRAEGEQGPDMLSSFFQVIRQDPVIRQVKLIAEPWDVGWAGYQVGNFPGLWSEWNGKYRDVVRDFWRGEPGTLAEFATRITGSADLYEEDGRTPRASVNFITAHDGFTLRDLVSYNEKHNEANGEDSNDGESHNRSWNCGVEGPTDDPEVNRLRAQQQRNFLATLLFSQGVPMISHGDELGRTQQGNNNVYCQDNELSWIHWDQADENLIEFTAKMIGLRHLHPVFRRREYFDGRPMSREDSTDLPDIVWLEPDATAKDESDWDSYHAKSIAFFLNGHDLPASGRHGASDDDHDFYILLNAHWEPVEYTLPGEPFPSQWNLVVDTASASSDVLAFTAGDKVTVPGRGIVILQSTDR
ncbi:glycogen debranching protein GlgX [Micrococcus terreus]|uniref:glycogen debranching protein GlgX n=1 Tax=Micrococcus terreus TaxID=574650 RepID=UPI0023FA2591|nr:glycogen debranching protein GlgX [Micrococcus terreus]